MQGSNPAVCTLDGWMVPHENAMMDKLDTPIVRCALTSTPEPQ